MLEPVVRAALLEDLGRAGDLTTDAIVPADAQAETRLVARQEGVLAGLDLARLAFRALDPAIRFSVSRADAACWNPARRSRVSGRRPRHATAARGAELCHLSGVATATASITRAVAPYARA